MWRARPLLAWVTVTSLSTLVTWEVVATASDQVNDLPQTPLVVAVAAPATTVFLTVPSTGETTVVSSASSSPTTSDLPDETVSPTSYTTTTTSPPPPPAPSPTSIAQPSPTSGVATVHSAGGTVTVSYRDGQVFFEGATPASGYSVEVEDEGPEHVVVGFESEDETIEVRIEWSDGKLVWEVDAED